MNNTYKISSIVLIIVLSFFAIKASLQEVDTSGDTGTTMDIVEPQDGVSLDGTQSSLEGVENSGLSVGEAGQEVGLKLGEPETPVLLGNGLSRETDSGAGGQSSTLTPPVILNEVKNPDGGATDTGSFVANAPQDDTNGQLTAEAPAVGEVKEYWVYIRTYDKPEVSLGQTGGRSKKGDIVQV